MFKTPEKILVDFGSINSNKSFKTILFVLPGLEGNVNSFAEFAECLENNQVRVFGLQHTLEAPNGSIESLAKFYIKEISKKLEELNEIRFNLVGYSFGGIVSIEIARQVEAMQSSRLILSNLIIFESSQKFFKYGALKNAHMFGTCIQNDDIFKDQKIYTGTLSIYMSYMIGQPKFKYLLYDYLNRINLINLDDALDKAFDFVKLNNEFSFKDQEEYLEMRQYLKILLLKSNAGFIYSFDLDFKLKVQTLLVKSKNFLYKEFSECLYYFNEKKKKFCSNSINGIFV